MKFLKILFLLALGAGLFYVANNVPINGKTAVQYVTSFNADKVQDQVKDKFNDAKKEVVKEMEKKTRAGEKKLGKAADAVEDYTTDERKVIDNAIGDALDKVLK